LIIRPRVASLHIRHGQLICPDFHQLDCSLVGPTDAHAEIAIRDCSIIQL
jgi:hypothetical protein